MAIPALFRNSLVYMLGNVANGLVPFLLLPVLTRYLTPTELGMVVSYQLLFSICVALSTLSLQGAVSVEYFKRGSEQVSSFVAACMAIVLVAGIAVVIGIGALSLSPWLDFLSLAPGWLVWCAASAALSGGASLLLVLWQSSEKPVPYVIFQFGQTIANASLSLALVVGLGAGADGRLAGLALPVTIFGLGAVAWLFLSRRAHGPVTHSDIRVALRFGMPLLPHALAAIFIAQGDRMILALQAGLGEAGIYAVAMQLLLPFIMVADAINRAFAPWIYRKLKEDRQVDVASGQLLLAFTYLAGAFVYLALVAFGIGIFLGENYHRASDFFYFIFPGAVSTALYYVVVNPIFFAGRTELLTAVTLTSTIVYLGIGWAAAGLLGGRGLAMTYSLVTIGQTLAVFAVSQRVHHLPFVEGARNLREHMVRLVSRWVRPSA